MVLPLSAPSRDPRPSSIFRETYTHNGAAADDADQDDESVIVEILAQHEHVGVGGLVALVIALSATTAAAGTFQQDQSIGARVKPDACLHGVQKR